MVTFYIGPPPQPDNPPPPPHRGPLGPPWELPWTTIILHLRRYIHVSTHYVPWLFYMYFWIWRRCLKFSWFWPLGALSLGPNGGHMYHMNNFESPVPKDDSCQNSYFLHIGPPPQPVAPPPPPPHRGPLGPPWELPWTTFILHLTRYMYLGHSTELGNKVWHFT